MADRRHWLTGDTALFPAISVLSVTLEHLGLNKNFLQFDSAGVVCRNYKIHAGFKETDTQRYRTDHIPNFYHGHGNFSLQLVNIRDNPLVCDKDVVWLRDMEEDPCLSTNLEISPCAGPAEMKNREWNTLTRKELDPSGKT